MIASFEASRAGYRAMWDGMTVLPGKVAAADAIVGKIEAHKADYQKVENAIGTPWFFVAALHYRESDLDFKTHLHNGDPLTARTYHVPAGRPLKGDPPFNWYASAIDALTMRGLDKVASWSVERMGYEAEGYNGLGYEAHNENSPYVWAWSNRQQPGKYVSDGHYDPTAMDIQCGVMVILQRLAIADPAVAAIISQQPIKPVPTPVPVTPIKENSPMTTTVTLPNFASIPFATIEQQVVRILPFLPIVADFVPGLAPLVPVVTAAAPFLSAVLNVAVTVQADLAAGRPAQTSVVDALRALATQVEALAK